MCDTKRAVDAIAVLKGRLHGTIELIVARVAEVMGSEAAVESCRAAELAFPVDLFVAVLFAGSGACTDLLKETVLAEEIFFLGVVLLGVCHLLLAVDQPTEVRLLARVALVEGAAMESVLLWFAEVGITLGCEAGVAQETLLLSVFKSLFLDSLFKGVERAEGLSDGA